MSWAKPGKESADDDPAYDDDEPSAAVDDSAFVDDSFMAFLSRRRRLRAVADADGLSSADLILGPEAADGSTTAGAVLLNIATGASSRTGDLCLNLEDEDSSGFGTPDRDRDAASTASNNLPARLFLRAAPSDCRVGDSLSPSAGDPAAELSTPGLRCAVELRCDRPWITSERVSGTPVAPDSFPFATS